MAYNTARQVLVACARTESDQLTETFKAASLLDYA
jgi:hypothetical protein